ncbi:hypothetical protein B7494_g1415 [Chlorociboria aeruginascens]|nr:hypothetical protein B7494_g1415 [Chlorociboria aeruginascens]
MTDYERTVLDHYQLSTGYPVEWPPEKDLSDASDEEEETSKPRNAISRRKSRYSALERVASDRRSTVPGSQKTGDGVENMVQRDEPDPLGTTDSVVRILRQLGNRFLLSSTTFSPAMFLSQVHSTASTQSLLQGLDVLSRSIDQKSASLKVLVESNFERFVRAKATIDNVYTEMKYRGADPTPSPRRHSRHASRNSFRASSGNLAAMAFSPSDAKKKNALTKESEYGVMGIKTPLLDVSAKAEEVWGPALGGREKEDSLQTMSETVEKYKEYYEVNAAITESIKRRDYESLVEEYGKARRFADDAKKLADNLAAKPSDAQIHQILLAARMWHDVEEQTEDFKRVVWRRLIAVQGSSRSESGSGGQQDQHMELIGILLELGVTDNPIWVWLLSRYDHLKNKIQIFSDRSKVEIEVLRRQLANGEKPTSQVVAAHLRLSSRQSMEEKPTSVDSPDVIELWEKMHSFLNNMLSSQGILGEIMEFWQTAQSFIEGKAQKTLPSGLNGESRKHHRLSDQGTVDLQKGTLELIDMIRESIFGFFAEPPIEDISAMFSPLPLTPKTPKPSGTQLTPTAFRDPRFNFDPNNPPPPSPKRGEAWEKFAFWPPWSNSLSGVHYLAKLLVLVGTGASEMGSISLVENGDGAALERLRALVGSARERCVTAICAAWNRDAENIKVLEDWRRSTEKRDLTRMPANFGSFEGTILSGMQKILYISEAKSSASDVILPPPAKLLQMVRSQFVTTLYKALSGMVENAEKAILKSDDDWTIDNDGLASPVAIMAATSIGAGTVNASDRNVRMLLTLSNLYALRIDIVPNLTTQFENAFSVKLTDESKTIRDVLGQIDARLFASYTRPSVETLRNIIRAALSSPSWSPAPNEKPKEVRPYVYEALLSLVLVHTQVSTTASSLTSQVLSYLLEQASRELLEAFKLRQKYTLSELMQATLDVEFVAQTLSQYTTDRASETQSQIYQELDKGTDNEARTKLQSELPEMRAVLKRLRESSRIHLGGSEFDLRETSLFFSTSSVAQQSLSMILANEEKIRDLVEVYFRVVYPIFPIFHRPSFMRRITSREYLSDHACFAEVMSMCALASARARDGALLPGRWAPGHFDDPLPEKFYRAASSVVPSNLNSMKGLDWMRTCSLLALYGIQVGRVEIMHKFLGLYLSLVAADNFQDEKNWPQGSIVEIELRRRLFWSMYSLEVYSSIVWGSVIRCREAQSYVKFPTEIDDENFSDLGYENKGSISSSPVWLQGWNFTTQLYCVLEHAMDEFHHRRSRHSDASSPQNMYRGQVPPEKAVLNQVMHMYEALPEEFKKATLHSAMGRAGEGDRCSFQAAHITATLQLLRMILSTAEDATVDQTCAIAQDLLGGFAQVPFFVLRAMSSPLLYHVASTGSLLDSIIEGPLSDLAYIQVRQALSKMDEFLCNLEAEIKHEVGASGRVRAQITKLDSHMSAQRQQYFASGISNLSGGPSMQNTLTNTSLSPDIDSSLAMRISMPNFIGCNPFAQRAYEFSGDGNEGNAGGNHYSLNEAYNFCRHEDIDAEGELDDFNQPAGIQ